MSKKYAEEKSIKNRDYPKTIMFRPSIRFLTRQEMSFLAKNRV